MSNKCQWVKTSERLPTKSKNYVCIIEVEDEGLKYYPATIVTFSEGWINPSVCGTVGEVIEWLEEDNAELPNLQKSTENLAKIDDKDKWLKEVKGENSISEEDLEKEMYDTFIHNYDYDYIAKECAGIAEQYATSKLSAAKELLLQAKYQLEALDNQFPTKGTKAVIQEIENFLK